MTRKTLIAVTATVAAAALGGVITAMALQGPSEGERSSKADVHESPCAEGRTSQGCAEEEPSPPTDPLLDGTYAVTARVKRSTGIFRFGGVGTTTKRRYTFTPTCRAGDCPVSLRQETGSGFASGEVASDGRSFTGRTTGPIHCYNDDTGEILRRGGFEGTFIHRIEPRATEMVEGRLVVTEFEGELTFSARPVKDPCNGRGRQVQTYSGRMIP